MVPDSCNAPTRSFSPISCVLIAIGKSEANRGFIRRIAPTGCSSNVASIKITSSELLIDYMQHWNFTGNCIFLIRMALAIDSSN